MPELKTIDMFNNQFERSNNDRAQDNNQEPFSYPACFISFENISWTGISSGVQDAALTVRLHIGYLNLIEFIPVFDLVQSIHLALQGYGDVIFNALTRVAERPNYDHNNVYVYEVDYTTRFRDTSTYNRKNYTPVSPVELDVSAELKIENVIIRTGTLE